MKQLFRLSLLALLVSGHNLARSQDDLMTLVNNDKPKIDFTEATFKTSRIVIGQSIESPAKGNLLFLITHHFGALNTGYENLFGLKQATIRLGLEYGLTERIGFGFGINTFKNTWDGFLKVKILRQCTGARKMPFTISAFANTAIYTTKWDNPDRKNYFTSRMSYCFQLMIARKFNNWLSLQLTPAMCHYNLTPTYEDKNDQFAIGLGGRIKVSQRVSVNAEYHYLIPNKFKSKTVYNSLSAGVDIETGGHVFQIFLTNSQGEFEQEFLTNTTGSWLKGDIYLGFNITRIFTIFNTKMN